MGAARVSASPCSMKSPSLAKTHTKPTAASKLRHQTWSIGNASMEDTASEDVAVTRPGHRVRAFARRHLACEGWDVAELHNDAFKKENDVHGRRRRRHRQRRCRDFTRSRHPHLGQEWTEVLTKGHKIIASAGEAHQTSCAKTKMGTGPRNRPTHWI